MKSNLKLFCFIVFGLCQIIFAQVDLQPLGFTTEAPIYFKNDLLNKK